MNSGPAVQNPVLTICIPTFNRASRLNGLLGKLTRQLGPRNPAVEIFVSDNASPDNTRDVVAEYAGRFPYISYQRNPENVGTDRNYDLAVRRSKGLFVWTLADDDLLEEGSIDKVISLIERHPNVALFFVDYAIFKDDFSVFVEPSANQERGCRLIAKGDDFFLRTRFANSFGSSNIFRRDAWASVKTEEYCDKLWLHLFITRDILADRPSFIVGERLVRAGFLTVSARRGEKKKEWRPGREYYMDAHLNFAEFAFSLPARGYAPEVARLGLEFSKKDNLNQIAMMKRTAAYNLGYYLEIAASMRRYFGREPSLWLIDLPVLFLPNLLIRIRHFVGPRLGKVYRSLRKTFNLSNVESL